MICQVCGGLVEHILWYMLGIVPPGNVTLLLGAWIHARHEHMLSMHLYGISFLANTAARYTISICLKN